LARASTPETTRVSENEFERSQRTPNPTVAVAASVKVVYEAERVTLA
jgi:hypothetical protein